MAAIERDNLAAQVALEPTCALELATQLRGLIIPFDQQVSLLGKPRFHIVQPLIECLHFAGLLEQRALEVCRAGTQYLDALALLVQLLTRNTGFAAFVVQTIGGVLELLLESIDLGLERID